MINVTARIINTIPQHNLGVRLSPKIVTPKNTAVTGSKAPRMAVGVEPILHSLRSAEEGYGCGEDCQCNQVPP